MRLYHLGQRRLVTGAERLAMHGVSMDVILKAALEHHSFPDSFYATLAGNSYVGPVLAAILISILTLLKPDMFPDKKSITGKKKKEEVGFDFLMDFLG